MSSLTRWVLAHKRTVVLSWIVLTIAGIAAAGPATDALEPEFSVPNKEGWETNRTIAQHYRGTGGDTSPLIPVVTLPRARASTRRRCAPTSRRSTSSSSEALPELARRLLRVDRRQDLRLRRTAAPRSRSSTRSPTRTRRSARTRRPRRRRARRSQGTTVAGQPVHLTGFDALFEDSGADSDGPGLLLEAMLGGLGALAVLPFVFASFLAIVPILMAFVSIMTTFLLLLGLTELTSVSPIVQFLIALLGLGVAIDYSLIVVSRWREERAHGRSGDEAVQKAMETAGRAVVFSGITVAIGLLALIALPLPFLRSMGYGGMLIPLVSTLVAITLLPVVLAKVGLAARLAAPAHRRQGQPRLDALGRRLVTRHRWIAAAAGMAVVLALVVAATDLQLGASDADTVAKSGDAYKGLVALEDAGIGEGALLPHEILVERRHRPGRRSPARSAGVEGIHGAVAPGGPAVAPATAPRSSRRSRSPTAAPPRARRHARRRCATRRTRSVPTCASAASPRSNADFIDAVYGSFPLMIALITITTFILLARAFRSLLLPAKAILLNVLSVAAAWGVLVLVWQHGYGSELIWGIEATGSIPSWMPLMIFAFLFGLSMDYEVFILARMREEYDRTGSTEQAVITGHRPHRPARHERGADPVPDVRRDGLGPGHGPEDVRHRPGRRHPARRDGHPGADRARGDRADGPLELVAAALARAAAPRGAVAAATRGDGRREG